MCQVVVSSRGKNGSGWSHRECWDRSGPRYTDQGRPAGEAGVRANGLATLKLAGKRLQAEATGSAKASARDTDLDEAMMEA